MNGKRMRRLFMPERFDGIHMGGFDGGVEAEADAYEAAEDEAADDAPGGDVRGVGLAAEIADDIRQNRGQAGAQGDSNRSAAEGNHRRFNEKLKRDVLALGTKGAADADLARALRDRGQHDVHDANAADNQ